MWNSLRLIFLFSLIFIVFILLKIPTSKDKNYVYCKDLNFSKAKLLNINNFSAFKAEIEISDWRRWQVINIKDLLNFEKFNQFTNRKRVKAELLIKSVKDQNINCKYDVMIRPHGDQKDHREGNYLPSLQVKILESNLFGITDFLLLRPQQRGYFNEIFVTALFRFTDMLAPRTSMVQIDFNNNNYKFIFQEKIRKEFIEFSGYKEGPILEGDERFVFDKGDVPFVNHRISNSSYLKKNKDNYHNSEYALSLLNKYGSIHDRKMHRNWLIDYFYISKINNRNDFIGLDIFDALMFATDSLAGLSVQDRRFYFNTINQKFYPIFYDGIPNIIDRNQNLISKSIKFDQLIKIQKKNMSFIIPSMFDGKISFSAKEGADRALRLVGSINILDFNNYLTDLGLKIDKNNLIKIINKIKSNLIEIKNFEQNKVFNLSQPNKKLFDEHYSKRYNKEKLVFYTADEEKFKICKIDYRDCEFIDKKSIDNNKILTQEAIYKSHKLIFVGKKLNEIIDTGWFFQDKDNIFLEKKISNFKIKFTEGISFDVDENYNIIKIKKYLPTSRILITNQKIADWTFIFEDLTNNLGNLKKSIFKDQNGNTGCINIYETSLSNVKFSIQGSYCEDGINFIRSEGHINVISIENSISDAIDFDFSNFIIDKLYIKNSNNDCIDFSFGNYKIDYTKLQSCGDKAVSVGEFSQIIINNLNVDLSNIGIASKDSSNTLIKNHKFNTVQNCYSVYNKKQEFFGSYLKVENGSCENYLNAIDIDKLSLIEINKKEFSKTSTEKNIDKEKKDFLREVPYKNEDNSYNAVVEITKNTSHKWQISKVDGSLQQEFYKGTPRKVNFSPYPANYGIIPQTVLPLSAGGDGDPLDVFILGEKLNRGDVVKVRIIGVIRMLDFGEKDDKILAVRIKDKKFKNIKNINELKSIFPEEVNKIIQWLENYKGENITQILSIEEKVYSQNLIDYASSFFTKKGIRYR